MVLWSPLSAGYTFCRIKRAAMHVVRNLPNYELILDIMLIHISFGGCFAGVHIWPDYELSGYRTRQQGISQTSIGLQSWRAVSVCMEMQYHMRAIAVNFLDLDKCNGQRKCRGCYEWSFPSNLRRSNGGIVWQWQSDLQQVGLIKENDRKWQHDADLDYRVTSRIQFQEI